MLKLLKRTFSSTRTTLLLMMLYALLLAVATFLEKYATTATARAAIYNNPLFYLLQLAMVVNYLFLLFKSGRKLLVAPGVPLLHLSFVVILTGAWITASFGFEGIIHLRQGESTHTFFRQQLPNSSSVDAQQREELPFELQLNQFRLERYPGSKSPAAYESDLTIRYQNELRQETVAMNRVVYVGGYRLYQTSYDPDEQGSLLTLNHDPIGTAVTYLGYLLLLLSIPMTLFSSKSRFRQLTKRLKAIEMKQTALLLLLLPLFALTSCQKENHFDSMQTISAEHSVRVGEVLVQCPSGRIEPFNSYSAKLLRKIHRADCYKGYCAEQVVLGLIAFPDSWNEQPIIAQTNREIAQLLQNQSDQISFASLFNHKGDYRIDDAVRQAHAKSPKERTKLERDLLKLDEKANIIFNLQEGSLLQLFPLPGDSANKWYSPGDNLSRFAGRDSLFVAKIFDWYLDELHQAVASGRWEGADEVLAMITTYQNAKSNEGLIQPNVVKAELLYNRLSIFSILFKLYFVISILLLIVHTVGHSTHVSIKWMVRIGSGLLILLFLFHTLGIALRWYIAGQAPWSNAYETMVYVAWSATFAGLLFLKRSPLAFYLATFLSGAVLMVAHLNWLDPQITPLVPVLNSPWLMIHVAVITASYGFFGMSALIGGYTLISVSFSRKPIESIRLEELSIINELSLHLGLYLMTAGTFFGAVWANESWGRYWGWDPKETWALVTIIVYAIVLHLRLVPRIYNPFLLAVASFFAFSSVLMTYLGVNYFLNGLHSYGAGQTPSGLWTLYLLFGIMILVAYRAKNKWNRKSIN